MSLPPTFGPRCFDPLGPQVRRRSLPSGRTALYIDDGAPEWPAFAFFGGAGTSVRAFAQLSLVAISGGGPYAAALAARQPHRIRSLHLACAFSDRAGAQPASALLGDDERLGAFAATSARDPVGFWSYPPDSPIHRIPGFVDCCIEEGLRAFYAAGQMGAPHALAHELMLLRDTPLPDLSALTAPAYLYWGAADRVVPASHLARWREALPHIAAVRVYEGEGHDVQYRHWDQILADLTGHPKDRPVDLFDWGGG
jgi:non-heme chloroperoxidase